MSANVTVALTGFVFGGVFLLIAIFSTVSKVTLSVFNPWLLREVAYRDKPTVFRVLVFLYWLLGVGGIALGGATLAGAFR